MELDKQLWPAYKWRIRFRRRREAHVKGQGFSRIAHPPRQKADVGKKDSNLGSCRAPAPPVSRIEMAHAGLGMYGIKLAGPEQ